MSYENGRQQTGEAVHHAKVRGADGRPIDNLFPDQFDTGALAEDAGLRHPVVFRDREAVRPLNRHPSVRRLPSVIGNDAILHQERRPQCV
jgi:hypothetical protein